MQNHFYGCLIQPAASESRETFAVNENKLRFIINLKAAKAAGFDLDSRLLSLALELIKQYNIVVQIPEYGHDAQGLS